MGLVPGGRNNGDKVKKERNEGKKADYARETSLIGRK